jgi:hypothetical protein
MVGGGGRVDLSPSRRRAARRFDPAAAVGPCFARDGYASCLVGLLVGWLDCGGQAGGCRFGDGGNPGPMHALIASSESSRAESSGVSDASEQTHIRTTSGRGRPSQARPYSRSRSRRARSMVHANQQTLSPQKQSIQPDSAGGGGGTSNNRARQLGRGVRDWMMPAGLPRSIDLQQQAPSLICHTHIPLHSHRPAAFWRALLPAAAAALGCQPGGKPSSVDTTHTLLATTQVAQHSSSSKAVAGTGSSAARRTPHARRHVVAAGAAGVGAPEPADGAGQRALLSGLGHSRRHEVGASHYE